MYYNILEDFNIFTLRFESSLLNNQKDIEENKLFNIRYQHFLVYCVLLQLLQFKYIHVPFSFLLYH